MDYTKEEKTESYGKRPLWQWIIIYLVIGGIIYAGIYYFLSAKRGGVSYNQPGPQTQSATQQPSPQTTQSPETQNAITLTANGFSPANLTVKSGTTVSWVNKSGNTATVNSDPHPSHTAYPPLNLGSFPDNGTLSLTFNQPGTYGYHNHLNPAEKGTIIVE